MTKLKIAGIVIAVLLIGTFLMKWIWIIGVAAIAGVGAYVYINWFADSSTEEDDIKKLYK
ncbi:MAG: hypothetical protein DRG78_04465 [Epsilonproteobacteria bacterium]|nr:MAG: hypothetical protein DRG78_04465 [Campylobacterota bacterium]